MKKTTRIIAGLASASLLGLTPLALTAPAEAAGTYTTTATLSSLTTPPVAYGDTITLSGGITDSAGSSDVPGNATLMVLSTKNPVWTPVETDTTGGNYTFWDIKPVSNSLYKVVYAGHTATDFSGQTSTWAPSESAPFEVTVKRSVKVSIKGLTIKGKVSPDYSRKKVLIKKIVGKKLKKYTKVKTNKKGVFTFRAPGRSGFKFAVVVPTDKHYIGWASPYRVYRPAPGAPLLRRAG